MSYSLWPHGLYPTRLLSSWGFSRQEYWSGLPCPSPEDLPNPGTEPMSLTSPAWAGRFFTNSTTWEFSGPKVWCKEMHDLLLFYNFTLSVLNSPFPWAADSRVQGVQDFCPWGAVHPCEHQLRPPQSAVASGQQSAQVTVSHSPTISSFPFSGLGPCCFSILQGT